MEDVIELIRTSPSTVDALAGWLGVETLELDRVLSDTAHRLTQRERDLLVVHPGVFFGYHRSALLRTSMPSSRVVASVEATVTLDRLTHDDAAEVLAARRTLGSILLGLGANRRFLSVERGGRSDVAGNPVAFRTSFMFRLNGRPVAVVHEDVYESTIEFGRQLRTGAKRG